MKKHTLSSALLLILGFSATTFSATPNYIISGSIPGSVTIYQKDNNGRALLAAPVTHKPISFEHIILSPAAKHYLATHAGQPSQDLLTASAFATPAQADLGMNSVPVLDQGLHGTCVTFAVTGALDALLGHTDHISQLCNLELGLTLAKQDSDYPSGWDGSYNDIVLGQIQKYGAIPISFQKKNGCAKVKTYPLLQENNTGNPMTVAAFTQNSEKIMDNLSWKVLLSSSDAISSKAETEKVLANVKKAITNGHRVVIGLLIDVNVGDSGTAGHYKTVNDSWVLTKEIANDAKADRIDAGHALIITGYDDNAVVRDNDNVEHKGVLTIRNSWGVEAGDQGTYYMSYDYFTTLVVEADELLPTK